MGHKNGLDGVYFVPTRQQCFKEFVKGIFQLTIFDLERKKIEIAHLKEEKSKNQKLEEKLDALQENLNKVNQWKEMTQKYEKTA